MDERLANEVLGRWVARHHELYGELSNYIAAMNATFMEAVRDGFAEEDKKFEFSEKIRNYSPTPKSQPAPKKQAKVIPISVRWGGIRDSFLVKSLPPADRD